MTRFLEILVLVSLLSAAGTQFGSTAVAIGILVVVFVLAPLDRAYRQRRAAP